jgi:hypothetical protein
LANWELTNDCATGQGLGIAWRGSPGHRGYHARKIAEGQAMGEYKQEVTKKIVLGAIGLVFTMLGFIAGPALLRWLQ